MAAQDLTSETDGAALDGAPLRAAIVKRAVQVVLFIVLQRAILLGTAGRVDWPWAWAYLAIQAVGVAANFVVLLRYSPQTIAQRATTAGGKLWDKLLTGAWSAVYFFGVLGTAGLDSRLGWTLPLSTTIHVGGAIAFAAGYAMFSWAMVENAFFATLVRVQSNRGHRVCTTGPYRFVRHPGYVGSVLSCLGAPLMLGSPWALVPACAATLLLVVRTAWEDRTLHQELAGYRDYAGQTRYRLLPGVW